MIYITFIAHIYTFFSAIASTSVCDRKLYQTTCVGEFGNSYRIEKSLTEGGCGALFLAKNLNTQEVAVIKRSLGADSKDETFNRELKNMEILKSWPSTKNLVVAEDFYDSRKNTNEYATDSWISFKYYPKGDVLDYANNIRFLPLNEIRMILYDTLIGLNEMHSRGYAHFDIKLENLIVSSRTESSVHVKIIDFGFMRERKEYSSVERIGSPLYMSPEVRGISKYNSGDYCDIWSLGVSAVFLKTKSVNIAAFSIKYLLEFFANNSFQRFYSSIRKEIGCNNYPAECSEQNQMACFCDLVIGMLKLTPRKRITAAEALNHPFFAQVKSTRIVDDFNSEETNPVVPEEPYLNQPFQKDSILMKESDLNEGSQERVKLVMEQDLNAASLPEGDVISLAKPNSNQIFTLDESGAVVEPKDIEETIDPVSENLEQQNSLLPLKVHDKITDTRKIFNFTIMYLIHSGYDSGLNVFIAKDDYTNGLYDIYTPANRNSILVVMKMIDNIKEVRKLSKTDAFQLPKTYNSQFGFPWLAFKSNEMMNMEKYLSRPSVQLTYSDIKEIMFTLFKGLKEAHSKGYLLKGLKPKYLMPFNLTSSFDTKISSLIPLITLGQYQELKEESSESSVFEAPEIVEVAYQPVSYASNMWTAGAIAYYLKTKMIFNDGTTRREYYLKKIKKNLGCNYGPIQIIDNMCRVTKKDKICFCDLVIKLLRSQPVKRITAAMALHHPFLRSITG